MFRRPGPLCPYTCAYLHDDIIGLKTNQLCLATDFDLCDLPVGIKSESERARFHEDECETPLVRAPITNQFDANQNARKHATHRKYH